MARIEKTVDRGSTTYKLQHSKGVLIFKNQTFQEATKKQDLVNQQNQVSLNL
jgi:hypothetical protein